VNDLSASCEALTSHMDLITLSTVHQCQGRVLLLHQPPSIPGVHMAQWNNGSAEAGQFEEIHLS
jgi:hypothetical protein